MILAALTQGPSAPAAAEVETIRDIAPPVWALPYPLWMIVTACVLAVVLLALVIWWIVRSIRNRPAPPPPTAAAIARRELEKLRARVREMAPYEFSIAVSDVLRTFVSDAKFHLPATHQTSPEFLAAVSGSPLFSAADRTLLTRFLEKCDMIKFARIDATSDDSAELVASALEFVQGGRA
jgi:hypothetical protein